MEKSRGMLACFISLRSVAITINQMHNHGPMCVISLSIFPLQSNPPVSLQCYYSNGGLQEPTCPQAVFYVYHPTSHVQKAQRNHYYLLQSCPDAIEEVFNSKLHIIGGVGIAIGVIMVSA